MRSSSACSGSNSKVSARLRSSVTLTSATSRTSTWSATAATGRWPGSSTRKLTATSSGRIAPGPAARPERRDRGQRQHVRRQRQDRAARREIIGGRAGRGRHQHAVADQFVHHHPAVDRQLDLGGLASLAEQADLVDRGMLGDRSRRHRRRPHRQRRDLDRLGRGEPLGQAARPPLVHQEADRAAVHSEQRPLVARLEHRMERLQHEAVAAQHDQDVRPRRARPQCSAWRRLFGRRLRLVALRERAARSVGSRRGGASRSLIVPRNIGHFRPRATVPFRGARHGVVPLRFATMPSAWPAQWGRSV